MSQLLLSPIETPKNVIIICGCYAWFVVTRQGDLVGGQYNKQCFEEFTWKRLLVPRGDIKQFCSWSPTWPLWRHVQISNASRLNVSNAIFLLFFSGQNLTTPNIVGPIMLGFVASVCTWQKVSPLPKLTTRPVNFQAEKTVKAVVKVGKNSNSNSDHLIYIYLPDNGFYCFLCI